MLFVFDYFAHFRSPCILTLLSLSRFYGKNRGLRYGTSNCVIFSPNVPVIREDSVRGECTHFYAESSFNVYVIQADGTLYIPLYLVGKLLDTPGKVRDSLYALLFAL